MGRDFLEKGNALLSDFLSAEGEGGREGGEPLNKTQSIQTLNDPLGPQRVVTL